MKAQLRNSGIELIGDMPWGTHFCQFYQTKENLIDILVPYFKAGLENNESCMWVTSQFLTVNEAKEALKNEVPHEDTYLKTGQIEIIPHTDWYTTEGNFDPKKILSGWNEKLETSLIKGYEGLRIAGDTFWLEKEDWNDFAQYEGELNNIICGSNIIVLCTYSLDKCNAEDVIDVVNSHQFALTELEGEWALM